MTHDCQGKRAARAQLNLNLYQLAVISCQRLKFRRASSDLRKLKLLRMHLFDVTCDNFDVTCDNFDVTCDNGGLKLAIGDPRQKKERHTKTAPLPLVYFAQELKSFLGTIHTIAKLANLWLASLTDASDQFQAKLRAPLGDTRMVRSMVRSSKNNP